MGNLILNPRSKQEGSSKHPRCPLPTRAWYCKSWELRRGTAPSIEQWRNNKTCYHQFLLYFNSQSTINRNIASLCTPTQFFANERLEVNEFNNDTINSKYSELKMTFLKLTIFKKNKKICKDRNIDTPCVILMSYQRVKGSKIEKGF